MSDPTTPPPPVTTTPPATDPKTFSAEYVHELREENKTWRQKAQGHETAAQTAKREADEAKLAAEAKIAEAKEAADAKIAEANSAAQQRIIHAELKAVAAKAGMVDLDGLKLLDLTAVTINDAGEVEGADALIEAAKKAKPYLFGAPPASTSNPQQPPPPKPPAAKNARDMTDEEFDAARRAHAWRNK
jgi:hypothetical protein